MRGKRSKQYRKLMQQYCITFGFRQPYQCIVDAELVKDTTRFKMDLVASLERTLHGTVKPRMSIVFPFQEDRILGVVPLYFLLRDSEFSLNFFLSANHVFYPSTVITQCSIRHLYKDNADSNVAEAIEIAKSVCERRRCGHHPDEFPEPLSTLECLSSVVDAQKNGTNKHRYCVASQDADVRRGLRAIKGVPLVYVSRSVMIMEPISAATAQTKEREEVGKFREGIIRSRAKRKRMDGDDGDLERGERDEVKSDTLQSDTRSGGKWDEGEINGQIPESEVTAEKAGKKKKKRKYGPKGPNPLSIKKPKKPSTSQQTKKPPSVRASRQDTEPETKRKSRSRGGAPNALGG